MDLQHFAYVTRKRSVIVLSKPRREDQYCMWQHYLGALKDHIATVVRKSCIIVISIKAVEKTAKKMMVSPLQGLQKWSRQALRNNLEGMFLIWQKDEMDEIIN